MAMALRFGVRAVCRGIRKPVLMANRFNFSTLLEQKEHGEETRYIRQQESERQKALRAEMERILALDDKHEDKQELVDILAAKPASEQGFIEKFGLNDWKFAIPAGMLIGIPALSNDLIILDAEMQLTACFILFCSTLYTQVGGMIGKSLDDRSTEIFNELKTLDNAVKAQLTGAIKSNELSLTLSQDLKERYELIDNLAHMQAEVLNHKEEHNYRDAIVKKLDALAALESATTTALGARVVSSVKRDVLDLFQNDRAAKDKALNHAIQVLSTGAKGKMGKDVVGEAFSDALKNYKNKYQSSTAPDEILVKMEKEMAAIAAAPLVEGKGGNVYLTHPL